MDKEWALAFHELADKPDGEPDEPQDKKDKFTAFKQNKLLTSQGGKGSRLLGALKWGNLFHKVCRPADQE